MSVGWRQSQKGITPKYLSSPSASRSTAIARMMFATLTLLLSTTIFSSRSMSGTGNILRLLEYIKQSASADVPLGGHVLRKHSGGTHREPRVVVRRLMADGLRQWARILAAGCGAWLDAEWCYLPCNKPHPMVRVLISFRPAQYPCTIMLLRPDESAIIHALALAQKPPF